ncbi:MAG: type II toxin-antitoxin system prevent-host-death family antitoxin [Micropepsaceae bacterium]
MNDTWKAQDAKARFSELLDASIERGPQIVTRRGVNTSVVVEFEEWRGLQERARPNIKDWLLAPGARTETLVPPRRKYRHRKPPKF